MNECKVVKAGYLIKSPPQDKLMAQWHRRYFILWSNKLMEYYTSHEHKPQDYLKTINLSKCEDMVAPLPITNRPHVIKLSIRTGSKLRDYYLDCGDEKEMGAWTKCLAGVCRFSPVEKEEDTFEDEDQPIYHDIDDNVLPADLQPFARPRVHSAIPQLRTSASLDDMNCTTYEEPTTILSTNPPTNLPNNYHVLDNNGSLESSSEQKQDHPEEWYDDVGVDEQVVYTMNKHPPPIWRPEVELLRKPPLPPNRRAASSEPEDRDRCRQLKLPLPTSPSSSPSRRPLPPPKPKPNSPKSVGGLGGLLGIKDDPKFKQKLQEKREEIYGGNGISHGRSMSMGEGEEFYESVLYTVDDQVCEDDLHKSPPLVPPKTDTLMREVSGMHQKSSFSPPPPALPSRDQAPGGMAKRNPFPSHSNQSPLHKFSQASPRHKNGSTPATPPPLPSRELLDPTLPSYTLPPTYVPHPKEETPPPVPLRQSSNHAHPVSSPPHMRMASPQQDRRRNSLPSPGPTLRPLPAKRNIHSTTNVESQAAFAHTLASILANSPKSPSRKSLKSPPLVRQDREVESFEGYEDVHPPNDQLEEMYEDIDTRNHSASITEGFSESYDDIIPIFQPNSKSSHNPNLPPRNQQESSTSTQRTAAAKPHGRVTPHLPPNKPKMPDPAGNNAPHPPPRVSAGNAPVVKPRHSHGSPDATANPPVLKPRVPDRSSDSTANQPPSLKPRVPDHSRSSPAPDPINNPPPLKPRVPDHSRVSLGQDSMDNPPPLKPRVPDHTHSPPANKPRTEPTGNGPQNKPRPAAKKPPVSKKPAPPTSKPAVLKKPLPPTQPKPKVLLGNSPPSNSPPTRSRPKPVVSKKPVIPPLSS